MATFLNDTFTDTNGVALGSHTGETGATWTKNTQYSGTFTVQSNRVYPSAVPAGYYASGTPNSADYEVTIAVNYVTASVNQQVGVAGRMSTSADTMYFANLERVSTGGGTNTIVLYKVVAATYTVLGSAANSPVAGSDHTLKLRMVGTQISAYYDGALTLGPFTDSAITAAGNAGIRGAIAASTTTTGIHVDSVTAVDIRMPKLFAVRQAVNRAGTY